MKYTTILKEERKKRNLTQKQIAEVLNLSREAYTLYETGKNTPTTDSLIRLSDFYNLSIDYLLGRKTP